MNIPQTFKKNWTGNYFIPKVEAFLVYCSLKNLATMCHFG